MGGSHSKHGGNKKLFGKSRRHHADGNASAAAAAAAHSSVEGSASCSSLATTGDCVSESSSAIPTFDEATFADMLKALKATQAAAAAAASDSRLSFAEAPRSHFPSSTPASERATPAGERITPPSRHSHERQPSCGETSTPDRADLSRAPVVSSSLQRRMDHKALRYQRSDDLVAEVWALTAGLHGGAHDHVALGAPKGPNEDSRSETMRALKLCAAQPCPELNVLIEVVIKVMGIPHCVVDLWSGPTKGNTWVSHSTMTGAGPCPWELSACPWDLLTPYPALMVVEDMTADARFAHMPYADALRTYISSPIIASDGHRLGGFCVIDCKPHRMDLGRCRLMTNFSEMASRELERYADVWERLKDPDDLVHHTYNDSHHAVKRNLASAFDSCILIVDASKGFEVLYANTSWERWSGGLSRDTLVGCKLPDVLDGVSAVPLSWGLIASDAAAGARFVVPRVRVRASGASFVFDISFRCGALEALDNDTLPITIPTFVDLSVKQGGIYFGRLHKHDGLNVGLFPLDASSSANAQSMTAQQMARVAVPGLKLGQVLGRGGYAMAYVAEWHDTQVVCKVQDHLLHNDTQRNIAESEIAVGQELVHPNVVRTLAHGTIQLKRKLPLALSDRDRGDSHLLTALSDLVDYFVDDFDDFDCVPDLQSSDGSSMMTMMNYIDIQEVCQELQSNIDKEELLSGRLLGDAGHTASGRSGSGSSSHPYVTSSACAQAEAVTSGGHLGPESSSPSSPLPACIGSTGQRTALPPPPPHSPPVLPPSSSLLNSLALPSPSPVPSPVLPSSSRLRSYALRESGTGAAPRSDELRQGGGGPSSQGPDSSSPTHLAEARHLGGGDVVDTATPSAFDHDGEGDGASGDDGGSGGIALEGRRDRGLMSSPAATPAAGDSCVALTVAGDSCAAATAGGDDGKDPGDMDCDGGISGSDAEEEALGRRGRGLMSYPSSSLTDMGLDGRFHGAFGSVGAGGSELCSGDLDHNSSSLAAYNRGAFAQDAVFFGGGSGGGEGGDGGGGDELSASFKPSLLLDPAALASRAGDNNLKDILEGFSSLGSERDAEMLFAPAAASRGFGSSFGWSFAGPGKAVGLANTTSSGGGGRNAATGANISHTRPHNSYYGGASSGGDGPTFAPPSGGGDLATPNTSAFRLPPIAASLAHSGSNSMADAATLVFSTYAQPHQVGNPVVADLTMPAVASGGADSPSTCAGLVASAAQAPGAAAKPPAAVGAPSHDILAPPPGGTSSSFPLTAAAPQDCHFSARPATASHGSEAALAVAASRPGTALFSGRSLDARVNGGRKFVAEAAAEVKGSDAVTRRLSHELPSGSSLRSRVLRALNGSIQDLQSVAVPGSSGEGTQGSRAPDSLWLGSQDSQVLRSQDSQAAKRRDSLALSSGRTASNSQDTRLTGSPSSRTLTASGSGAVRSFGEEVARVGSSDLPPGAMGTAAAAAVAASVASPPPLSSMPSVASTAMSYQYPVELRSFLVMEYCDQGCLQDAIDRGWLREARHATARPATASVLRTALDIAEAMAYLHSKYIIHGDLTAFNVLLKSILSDAKLRGVDGERTVDQFGRPFVAKVADFGSSRRLPRAQDYIRSESYATVTHMSPEMLSSSKMGFACDVWAFGVLLWSMWTGSRPWAGLAHAQIVATVSANTASLQFPDNMPPALAALGRTCLAFEPAARPSFASICTDLRNLISDLPRRSVSASTAAVALLAPMVLGKQTTI